MDWSLNNLSSYLQFLPVKNYITIVTDWGLSIIDKFENYLKTSELLNLHKKIGELTYKNKELTTENIDLKNKLTQLLQRENFIKTKLENWQLLATELEGKLKFFYSEINNKMLLPLLIFLFLVVVFKTASILLNNYFKALVENNWILKKLFGSKVSEILEKKALILEKFKDLSKENENIVKDMEELTAEKAKQIKEKINLHNKLIQELKGIKDIKLLETLEKEAKFKEYRQLYVNICYTHINNMVKFSTALIENVWIKEAATKYFIESRETYLKLNNKGWLIFEYCMGSFFISSIKDREVFEKIVTDLIPLGFSNPTRTKEAFLKHLEHCTWRDNLITSNEQYDRELFLKNLTRTYWELETENQMTQNDYDTLDSLEVMGETDKKINSLIEDLYEKNDIFAKNMVDYKNMVEHGNPEYSLMSRYDLDKKVTVLYGLENQINIKHQFKGTYIREDLFSYSESLNHRERLIDEYTKSLYKSNAFEPFSGKCVSLDSIVDLLV